LKYIRFPSTLTTLYGSRDAFAASLHDPPVTEEGLTK